MKKQQEEKRNNIIQELHEYLTKGVANFPNPLKEKFEKAMSGLRKGDDKFRIILSSAVNYNEQCGSYFCQETLLGIQEDYAATTDNLEEFIRKETEKVKRKDGFFVDEIDTFLEGLTESNNLKPILESGAKPFPAKLMMSMAWLGNDSSPNELEKPEDEWECYATGMSLK